MAVAAEQMSQQQQHEKFLVWWRSVPALIHLDGDRQACIKTGLIPAGHLQGIALFYPAYAAGIRQLQAGEGVMFSCDCHPDGDRANGYWDPDCFQYGEVLGGLTFGMTKAERLLTRESTMNHCMMFYGVNLDENGKADRWKIENSWGDASGQKCYYIGSEKWFKANVYQITVRKSLLSDAQRALLDQEPLPMKLWDPLA